jgi:2-methylaconitate cis-trans-isomerase PrpF
MPDYPSLQLVAQLSNSSGTGTGTLTGTGNPNGVVTGAVGQMYVDTANAASPVIYVNGDGTNTGWK